MCNLKYWSNNCIQMVVWILDGYSDACCHDTGIWIKNHLNTKPVNISYSDKFFIQMFTILTPIVFGIGMFGIWAPTWLGSPWYNTTPFFPRTIKLIFQTFSNVFSRSSSAAFPLPSRSSVDPLLEKSTINANTNRNIASGSRVAASDAIPENAALHFDNSIRQMAESGLPPTVGYLVLLWEEIRSYCIHAILQQVK